MKHSNIIYFPEPAVAIPVSFFKSDIWKEIRTFSQWEAWLDLQYRFATSDTPGQVEVSLRTLGASWIWTTSRVARFLSKLEARQEIVTRVGKTDESAPGQAQTIIELCTPPVLKGGQS